MVQILLHHHRCVLWPVRMQQNTPFHQEAFHQTNEHASHFYEPSIEQTVRRLQPLRLNRCSIAPWGAVHATQSSPTPGSLWPCAAWWVFQMSTLGCDDKENQKKGEKSLEVEKRRMFSSKENVVIMALCASCALQR